MNYFIKQATLNKLASIRLAIQYVLRNRMLKFADTTTNPTTTSTPTASTSTPTNMQPLRTQTTPTMASNTRPRTTTGFKGYGATRNILSKVSPLASPPNLNIPDLSDQIPLIDSSSPSVPASPVQTPPVMPTFDSDPFEEYFDTADQSND